ncbi:MAG: holo-ACP synthase [Chloroflexota bacterium]
MKLRTGVDVVEISRIERLIQQYDKRFLNRIYTPKELTQVGTNLASLSARFAAKEATAKALGTGIGPVGWQDIEILSSAKKEPVLHLLGAAKRLADEQHLTIWSLSLSHTHTYAIAFVVAMSREEES